MNMQFAKIATAAVLAMGVSTFAVAQERVAPSDQLNRPAPSATQNSDHENLPSSSSPGMRRNDMNSGATGGDSRAAAGSAQGAQINEKNITPLLQAQGYTDVKGVKQSGDTITANAKKDGKSVKLNVDTKTGMVKESRS